MKYIFCNTNWFHEYLAQPWCSVKQQTETEAETCSAQSPEESVGSKYTTCVTHRGNEDPRQKMYFSGFCFSWGRNLSEFRPEIRSIISSMYETVTGSKIETTFQEHLCVST